jgi:hypothetical protein
MSRHLPDAIDAAIRSFESNRLIRKVAAEEATPRDYVALLLTLYHQVKSSAVTFAAAAAAAAGRSRDAAEYLMDHAHEEAGHYRWILNDLDAAGYDGPGPEALPIPKPTLAYIGVNHHCAAHWPLSRLAIAAFLEGVSGRLGSAYGLLAASQLSLPREAFSFFLSHGELDQGHAASIGAVLARAALTGEEERMAINHVDVAAALYSDMYDHAAAIAGSVPAGREN